VALRNFLFDKKILGSASFGLPLICIGNLAIGGTGKSPMVEWLLARLGNDFKLATLSRGYKRRTRGYALANANSTALDIGDEPMQFHLKYPGIPVAVGEERLLAIPQLLHDHPETEAIILDDAFQHRQVVAGLNILLTEQSNLFRHDFYLPTGDLRDLKSSYKRAQVIVVTKCKPQLTEEEAAKIIKEIRPLPEQRLFFTSIAYGQPYHIISKKEKPLNAETEVLLVTGIANPRPLKKWLEEQCGSYQMLQYPDHHIFSIDDLEDIRKKFNELGDKDRIILTTEKDAVRLDKFSTDIEKLPFYVIPVSHHFLFDRSDEFRTLVGDFIRNFKKTI
jgi:tetraacyldisaccharide 4'-kinase